MGEGTCRCCCVSYRTRVTLFAVTSVFIAGIQLLLPLIPSTFIVYFTANKRQFEATYILHEETISLFDRIPSILLKPKDSRRITVHDVGLPHSQLQSDLHVWASWIFLKLIMLLYSSLLYVGARKKSYGLVMSWFALNVPMVLHSALLLVLDFCLGLSGKKPLNAQIFQASLTAYNLLGLIFVLFYLRSIRHKDKNRRYRPEIRRDNDGKFRDPASLHFMYAASRRDFEVDGRYYDDVDMD